jgi:hypothetical protein
LIRNYNWLIYIGGVLASLALYLGIATQQTALGFPLDDAWIHQVFARNLAQHGQFAYNPGQLVAGSTSPLWSFLLVPGYWLNIGNDFYKTWAYFLGVLFLILTATQVYQLSLLLFKPATSDSSIKNSTDNNKNNNSMQKAALIAALFTIFEWHLVWAAVSGMETVLFTFVSLWLVRLYLQTEQSVKTNANFKPAWSYCKLGLVGGLLTLIRPEGLVLLGLIGLETGRQWFLASPSSKIRQWSKLGVKWGLLALAWLLLLLPYAIFNYVSSGSPLPTTFYAKASGYASDLSIGSTLLYWQNAFSEILIHSPLLFLGVLSLVYGLLLIIRPASRATIGQIDTRLLVWPLLVVVLYAIRLPVTYQHGRYLIPLVPIFSLYGVGATSRLLECLRQMRLPKIARAIPPILALVVVLTLYYGALSYQSDLQIINYEQVQIGQWLHDHTPDATIVASHDIGAIEYFSGRRIVDTAGLVSPEFIPIIHDEPKILEQVRTEGVTYFALMPAWHPEIYKLLMSQNRLVFQPTQEYLTQFGSDNLMRVFKLN